MTELQGKERINVLVRIRPLTAKDKGVGGPAIEVKKVLPKQTKKTSNVYMYKGKRKGGEGFDFQHNKFNGKKGGKKGKGKKAGGKEKKAKGDVVSWDWDEACIRDTTKNSEYVFDRIYGPEAESDDLYSDQIHKTVSDAIGGINGTVFAYGQTGSGKTHTMLGTSGNPGIIRLSARDLFGQISATGGVEYTVSVSYLEIYNEQVNDLMSKSKAVLQVVADKTEGVVIKGLSNCPVGSEEDIIKLLKKGENRRHYRKTDMNHRSSRSHTIFRLRLIAKHVDDSITVSVLNLIDLAGSECVGTANTSGTGRHEGANINKSLLALSRIIEMLSRDESGHLPFRDSNLTRILEPSLVGNSRINIICTMNPASRKAKESHNTLMFASNAKKVTKAAVIKNEIIATIDGDLLLKYQEQMDELRRLRQENETFRREIEALRSQLAEKEQVIQQGGVPGGTGSPRPSTPSSTASTKTAKTTKTAGTGGRGRSTKKAGRGRGGSGGRARTARGRSRGRGRGRAKGGRGGAKAKPDPKPAEAKAPPVLKRQASEKTLQLEKEIAELKEELQRKQEDSPFYKDPRADKTGSILDDEEDSYYSSEYVSEYTEEYVTDSQEGEDEDEYTEEYEEAWEDEYESED